MHVIGYSKNMTNTTDLDNKLINILADHTKTMEEARAAGGGIGIYRGTIDMIKKAFADDSIKLISTSFNQYGEPKTYEVEYCGHEVTLSVTQYLDLLKREYDKR